MLEKVRATLASILDKFQSGLIPEAIAFSTFPIPDIPASHWSLLNRTIMFFSGTQDARGFRQWQHSNRFVKKGAKAICILAPLIVKQTKEGEELVILRGFKAVPVFRVEDTDGEPLDYQQIELPDFPLIERAKEWGIEVKAVPGNYRYHGYYSGKRSEIGIASPEECIFFHELSHAAHERACGTLQGGQHWNQEIVAELSAQALCYMVGKAPGSTLGNSYQYIAQYAEEAKLSPIGACLKCLGDVEKTIGLVLSPVHAENLPSEAVEAHNASQEELCPLPTG
jgi:hypothetical protein